jgi:signal transduction histidine kinase
MWSFLRWRYMQKIQRQRELEELRTRISSDLHDDVGSLLSGLALHSEITAYTTKDATIKTALNEISLTSRKAMEHMRDTVWAIDARKDKFENLIDRMQAFIEQIFEKTPFTHSFDVHGIEGGAFINPEVRQHIYFIFKEAVTNIIAHSNGTHVSISFSKRGEHISLSVHDNGTMSSTASSDGLGLSNMRMRAGKLGGRLQVEDQDGWKITLSV